MKQIIDCTTGEVIERQLTPQELEQAEIDSQLSQIQRQEFEAAAAAKAAAAASAVAKLEAIGLTADEIAALRG